MAAEVKKIQAQGRCARWCEFKSKFVGINVNDRYKQKKNLFRFIHQNNGLTTPNIYAEECICLDSFYFYSALDLPAEI